MRKHAIRGRYSHMPDVVLLLLLLLLLGGPAAGTRPVRVRLQAVKQGAAAGHVLCGLWLQHALDLSKLPGLFGLPHGCWACLLPLPVLLLLYWPQLPAPEVRWAAQTSGGMAITTGAVCALV
jgi:hypothetical protein